MCLSLPMLVRAALSPGALRDSWTNHPNGVCSSGARLIDGKDTIRRACKWTEWTRKTWEIPPNVRFWKLHEASSSQQCSRIQIVDEVHSAQNPRERCETGEVCFLHGRFSESRFRKQAALWARIPQGLSRQVGSQIKDLPNLPPRILS